MRAQTVLQRVDVSAPEARSALAKMTMKLFNLWGLSSGDQLELLGLSAKSRAMLTRYRNGDVLPESRDTMDRVGWLLAIHKALGLLYPYNEDIRYSWVRRRNLAFANLAPIDVMKEQGLIGIARVARYLDAYRRM